jgi:hypothetical protein
MIKIKEEKGYHMMSFSKWLACIHTPKAQGRLDQQSQTTTNERVKVKEIIIEVEVKQYPSVYIMMTTPVSSLTYYISCCKSVSNCEQSAGLATCDAKVKDI